MRLFVSGLVVVCVLFAGVAQSEVIKIISPAEFANVEGGGVIDNHPPNYRLQQVDLADQFSSLPVGNNLITQFAWRTDGSLDVPLTSTIDRLVVRLSTTSKGLNDFDQMFLGNVGADETTVFDGPIVWELTDAEPVGGPRDFEFVVPLTTPFRYDPSKGNLLTEVVVNGASQRLGLDFTFPVGTTVNSRFIWTGGGIRDSADGNVYGGHIAEFTFIPEPSTLILLAMGAFGVLAYAWRRMTRTGCTTNTCPGWTGVAFCAAGLRGTTAM